MYLEKFGVDGTVDAEYWAHNNPATIASKAPGTLRRLAIRAPVGSALERLVFRAPRRRSTDP